MARNPWTKQRVVDAILDCHRRGVPVDHIWRECQTACVMAFRLFGSWREALAAAGLESSRQRWSRERVIEELQARYRATRDLRKRQDRLAGAADRYFGNWRKALLAAGLPVPKERTPQSEWTAAEVLAAIQSRHAQGLPITGLGCTDPPLFAAGRRRFGGWRRALCAAGLASPPRELLTAEQTVRAIQERQRQGLPLKGLQHQVPWLYNAAMRNFGSWRRALSEAGIESKPCQRWQQDRVIAAIRERLQQGLPLSRVWREDKPLFRAAVNHFGNWKNALQAAGLEFKTCRQWSKERIITDLRGWYCQGQSSIRQVDPNLAAAAALYFGRFENALEAAGLDPPPSRWTKRRIIEAIQDGYVQGRPIAVSGCRDKHLAAAAKRHFGTWRAAVEAAGLLLRMPPPVVQREWSAQAVVEAIRALSHNGVIKAIWKVDTGLYSVAKKHFGSWRAALQAAGLQPTQRQWSRQAVITEILARYERGLTLSSAIFREDGRLGGAAIRYFGSWREALQAAGIDPNQVMATTREHEKGAVA